MSSANADVDVADAPGRNDDSGGRKLIIIQGTTNDGRKFRPSDWAERMSGVLSSFGGGRIQYSPMLRPIAYNGVKSVIVDPALRQHNPALFEYLMEFARANNLKVTETEAAE